MRGGDEETSSCAVRVSCGGGGGGGERGRGRRIGTRGTASRGERANRCTCTACEKDTWYRRRLAECVEPVRCVVGVITRCRRIVHASPAVVCSDTIYEMPDDSENLCPDRALLARRRCRSTPHPSGQPSACSRCSSPQCTPATGIFAVVRMQSIITQIRLHRRAWGNSRRGAGPALRNQSDSLRVTQWNPSR